jgi:hypothetical protein
MSPEDASANSNTTRDGTGRPLFALKTIVAGDCGALRQRAALSRNPLDMAA